MIQIERAVVEQALATLKASKQMATYADLKAALEASKDVEPVCKWPKGRCACDELIHPAPAVPEVKEGCPFCGSTSGFHRHTCINFKCDPETGEPLRDTDSTAQQYHQRLATEYEKGLSICEADYRELAAKYDELLDQISTLHGCETRHQTALRYIRAAENQANTMLQAAPKPD